MEQLRLKITRQPCSALPANVPSDALTQNGLKMWSMRQSCFSKSFKACGEKI